MIILLPFLLFFFSLLSSPLSSPPPLGFVSQSHTPAQLDPDSEHRRQTYIIISRHVIWKPISRPHTTGV